MGYSKSKETIDRVRDILDVVLLITDRNVEIPSLNPSKAVYAIRDALRVAKESTGEDHKYFEIKERFVLRTKPKFILFELREKLNFGDPISVLAKTKIDELVLENCTTLLEVVGACIKHKENRMTFPNADLGDNPLEMVKLSGWCKRNNYSFTTHPLTLMKNDSTTQDDTSIEG